MATSPTKAATEPANGAAADTVAGYTGVTASGAGYTGAAPVAMPSQPGGAYQNVIAPKTPLADSAYNLPISPVTVQELVARDAPKPYPEIRADTRTPEERQADRANFDLEVELRERYDWFDGSAGAWQLVNLQEGPAIIERYRQLLDAFEGASRVLSRTPIYQESDVRPVPRTEYFEQPVPARPLR